MILYNKYKTNINRAPSFAGGFRLSISLKFNFFAAFSRILFSEGAAEKLLISRKPLYKQFPKDKVWAGIK